MLTTASTPGQGGGHPAAGGTKVQGFPTGYLPVPTSATPGAGQTLVFGQLGVLGSPQPPSIQQQQQQQSANKQDQVQKVTLFLFYLIIDILCSIILLFLKCVVYYMYSCYSIRRTRWYAICSLAIYTTSCLDWNTTTSTFN